MIAADLIIYALVAAGLIFWLRNILGTRHEDEPQRPASVSQMPKITAQELEAHLGLQEKSDSTNAETLIKDLAENPTPVLSISGEEAQKGLLAIAEASKQFDIKHFLNTAQDVLVMVVESFAEGDRDSLKDLLAEPVYKAFDTAITSREEREETQVIEIQSVQHAEVIEAKYEDKHAFITVKFTAEENSLTKNNKGEITTGHPEKISEMVDIWTFTRDMRSKDPRWLVSETRGDFDGDNDLVPDSD